MTYAIGELARRSGVKVPTIRYYEQIGLLSEPERTDGQQRRYGDGALTRLNFIRHARELGFDIPAIRELVALTTNPQQSCAEADGIASRHLEEVRSRIRHLKMLEAELQHMVSECRHGRVGECGVIRVLGEAVA